MGLKLSERSSGLLLHITSLPGPYFSGDLGASARAFVDFLADARQRWWQMLPVNPIGEGNSPYSTVSSFAGEPLLIDLEGLVKAGWLRRSEIAKPKNGAGQSVNYEASLAFRLARLRTAFGRAQPKLAADRDFAAFRARERDWLADFALFGALSEHHGSPDWTKWPAELRRRDPAALAAARRELEDEALFLEFTQFVFMQQWDELKARAAAKGIGLIGDLPIFVAHSSADVWANQAYFRLGADGRPTVVAGCPPDSFNKNGQRWGNALYDWDRLQADGFGWWISRLRRLLALFDAVRLDHFIGFSRYWEIQATEKTAKNGRWLPSPGDAFFTAVVKALGQPQLIAEDLGAVTPAVRALRDRFGFPGMKVLQFAFGGDEEAEHHKPHRLPPTSVAYTGTHDNDTVRGWYDDLAKAAPKNKAAAKAKANADAYLGAGRSGVARAMMRAAFASQANVVVTPVQDVLGQGGSARMNVPGLAKGNWRYRVQDKALSKSVAGELADLTRVYDRGP